MIGIADMKESSNMLRLRLGAPAGSIILVALGRMTDGKGGR